MSGTHKSYQKQMVKRYVNGNWQHTSWCQCHQSRERKKNNHCVLLWSDHRESLCLLEDFPNPVFGNLACKFTVLRMQSSPAPSGIKQTPPWRMYYQLQCMDGSSLIGLIYWKVQWKRLFLLNYLHVSLMISEGIAQLQLNLSLLALNPKALMSK